MHGLPHRYSVVTAATPVGGVEMFGEDLPALETALPMQFGGAGDRWSPETLVVGAVADCLALTFRGVARARQLLWLSLQCEAVGTLDRVDGLLQFTAFDLYVRVAVPEGGDVEEVRRALEKAERTCLIANSLKAPVHLEAEVFIEDAIGALVGD